MKYCTECGTALQIRYHEGEKKELPFCEGCARFRYPTYNTAVSMIVTDAAEEHVILIKQYGKDRNVLVAGYINRGESAEEAVVREVKEELDLDVISLKYNRSSYFERTNTLMVNFSCRVANIEAHPNEEVDAWGAYTPAEAKEKIARGSLAEQFYLHWLENRF